MESEWLQPGEVLEIRDDTAAQVFLREVGLLERFPENRGGEPVMAVVVDAEHATHAIVATYFAGHPERKDNGHAVFCFPKSKFTPQDVDTYIGVLRKSGNVTVEGWSPQPGWRC